MLKGFPKGYDLSLINTIYHRSKKMSNGKYSNDAITLIFKDNNTKLKHYQTIESPDYEYYITKDGYTYDYNQLFIQIDKVDKVTVKYKDLLKDIAERTNNVEFFYDNIKNNNRWENNRLHTHTSVFMSDINIEDFYRFKFNDTYPLSDNLILTKSYLDIEVDGIDAKSDFPELGECPINAVTLIDGTSNKVYTLLLKNDKNPLIEDFISRLKDKPNEFFNKLKDTISYAVGGHKNVLRYGLDKLDFQLQFYDDELQLIHDLFILINNSKVDFVLAWNMAFDIPYIIERLKKLRVNPESVMCHEDFKYKEVYYYVDEFRKNEFAERGDFARISSYSVFLDQMIHFASRRKGQSAIRSYRLDYIGQVIANVKKLDYSHITTEIKELPYKDYDTFVIYNIIDTIVQKCIELKTDDISYVYNKSNMNNVRYEKCHRNTIYLKNRGVSEFFKDGLVMGNNCNFNNTKVPYIGGLVGDPKLIIPNGMKLNDVYINLYNNILDYDFKSLYPSMMIEFNIAPHTQLGKILMDNVNHIENENEFNDSDYNRSGSFLSDLGTHSYLLIASKWFKLANYRQLLEDINYYYTNIVYSARPLREVTIDGLIIPFNHINDNIIIKPINTMDKIIKPFTVYKNIPKLSGGDNNGNYF